MGIDIDVVNTEPSHGTGFHGGHGKTKTLVRATSSLAFLAQKLSCRLRYWMRETQIDKISGSGPIPDQDWRETFDLYQKTVLGLLKEQRERQKLTDAVIKKGGAAVLTSGEYDAELMSLARETVLGMPQDQLDALIAERTKP